MPYILTPHFLFYEFFFFCNIIEIHFWIYKMYLFQVYNLTIFTKFTKLYNHHHKPVLEHFLNVHFLEQPLRSLMTFQHCF